LGSSGGYGGRTNVPKPRKGGGKANGEKNQKNKIKGGGEGANQGKRKHILPMPPDRLFWGDTKNGPEGRRG